MPRLCRGIGSLLPAADEAILSKLERYVLDPEVIAGVIADAVQELQPSNAAVERKRSVLQVELRRVEDEQARYVAAIAVARNVDVLARALQDREHERTRVLHELASLNTLGQLGRFDRKRIEADLYGRVYDWRQTLRRQMPLSRQVVAHLLDGRIAWTPRRDEGLYEFRGRVKFDGLVNGLVVTQVVTSPSGIEAVCNAELAEIRVRALAA